MMHNQNEVALFVRHALLAIGLLAAPAGTSHAADDTRESSSAAAVQIRANQGTAVKAGLIATDGDDIPTFFPLNQMDGPQVSPSLSSDLIPSLFIDAGDPGFGSTEPGLPEGAIIPDLDLIVPPPPKEFERFWRRFSAGFHDWTSRISIGGRLLAGNSNQNFVDFAADFEKKQELRSTQINLQGQFGESNDVVVANRWFANSTTDYYHGSNWMTFTKLMDQYDQLQNLNYRGTFSGGAGYRFFFEEQRRLLLRIGPGVTTEFFNNPTRNRTTPDMFGEIELRLPMWDRLKWEQKTIVFPSLSALEVARAQSQTSFLFAFDEQERWSMKLGFQYQYISEPNPGRLPNDFTTNVAIVYLRK
jgi:hypothetical protein